MKSYAEMTPAERSIFRLSEISDLALRLSAAGRAAGLHSLPSRGQRAWREAGLDANFAPPNPSVARSAAGGKGDRRLGLNPPPPPHPG